MAGLACRYRRCVYANMSRSYTETHDSTYYQYCLSEYNPRRKEKNQKIKWSRLVIDNFSSSVCFFSTCDETF